MDIKGKVAIVTGSSSISGVGGETAKLLASHGCKVAVNYVDNRSGADETVAACVAAGADAFAFKADVANDLDCKRLTAAAIERWGRLDILVNNAATTRAIAADDLDALNAAEFQRTYAVNVIGSFQMVRAAAPHLKASGDAAIVNISSMSALTGAGSSMAYAASKGALNTLTLSLAQTLAPIRVNAICPGGLFGSWARKVLSPEIYEAKLRAAETGLPLRRAVWPVDVAQAALWLIEGAGTMTGELIHMDSGRHLS
jgi:3-oxoacyl-[acyl-carrier protein] reductase